MRTSAEAAYGTRTSPSSSIVYAGQVRRKTMGNLPSPLAYLLLAWGVITAVLVLMLIYRTTLSTKEDDQLYLNKAEVEMMGADQTVLIGKLQRLTKPIIWLAVLSGVLLIASAGFWVWVGLSGS